VDIAFPEMSHIGDKVQAVDVAEVQLECIEQSVDEE